MSVYVTGGSGFLGQSVVAALAAAGTSVISADLRTPQRQVDGVTYLSTDITDAAVVSQQIGAHEIDTVVHLASIVNPGKDTTREQAYAVDVTGTRNVLDACALHGVRRIVVSSSGAAYGYHADNPDWIDETTPLRGNPEFAYSDHKRRVEEMLAAELTANPGLQQVILRIGTILGARVANQITALFDRKRLLAIRGSDSPFVFIWDEDVVAIIVAATGNAATGAFNVAGDGAMTIHEIAASLGKRTLTVPEPLLRLALSVAGGLRLTAYGPEQTKFLRYRPVLLNTKLKQEFRYVPRWTSSEAFEAWRTRA